MSKQTKPKMIYAIRRKLTIGQRNTLNAKWWDHLMYLPEEELKGNLAKVFERTTFTKLRKYVTVKTLRELRKWCIGVNSNKHRWPKKTSQIHREMIDKQKKVTTDEYIYLKRKSLKSGFHANEINDKDLPQYLMVTKEPYYSSIAKPILDNYEVITRGVADEYFSRYHIEMAIHTFERDIIKLVEGEPIYQSEPKGTNPLKGIEGKLGEIYSILTEFKSGDDSIGNTFALVKDIHKDCYEIKQKQKEHDVALKQIQTRLEQISRKQCDHDSQLIIIKNDTQRTHEKVELLLENKDVQKVEKESKPKPAIACVDDYYMFTTYDKKIWGNMTSADVYPLEVAFVKHNNEWFNYRELEQRIEDHKIDFDTEVIIQTHIDPDNFNQYVTPYLMPGQSLL